MTTERTHLWKLAHGRAIDLGRPRLIAIVNTTPDSFFEPSRSVSAGAALDAAARAVAEGADMLDIGGESTRPGAERVGPPEQIRRVVPVIDAIRASTDRAVASVPISVDTTRAEVAEAALDAGADAVNDVAAGTEDDRLFPLCARRGAGLIIMHRAAPPERDSYSDRYAAPPMYADVVEDVGRFLAERRDHATALGVDRDALVLDPGLGFGKTVDQNAELVRRTGELLELGVPILSALSRKSFVGRTSIPGRDSTPEERLPGTIAWSVAHLLGGCRLFRVHDTRELARALGAAWAVLGPRLPAA